MVCFSVSGMGIVDCIVLCGCVCWLRCVFVLRVRATRGIFTIALLGAGAGGVVGLVEGGGRGPELAQVDDVILRPVESCDTILSTDGFEIRTLA